MNKIIFSSLLLISISLPSFCVWSGSFVPVQTRVERTTDDRTICVIKTSGGMFYGIPSNEPGYNEAVELSKQAVLTGKKIQVNHVDGGNGNPQMNSTIYSYYLGAKIDYCHIIGIALNF